MNAG
jgi:hypothetical protein